MITDYAAVHHATNVALGLVVVSVVLFFATVLGWAARDTR